MEVTVDIDTDDIVSEVIDSIDYSDIADTVMDKIDYDDIADEVVRNHLDYSDIASSVHEYIDVSDEAYNLLEQYDPTRNCSTGNAFTAAVKRAIEYLNSVSAAEEVVLEIPDQTVAVPEQEGVEVPVVDSPISSDVPVSQQLIITNGEKAKLKDIGITMTKRVVNELFNQYVPNFGTDPLMRIRLEAKAFDILNEEFDKEFSV